MKSIQKGVPLLKGKRAGKRLAVLLAAAASLVGIVAGPLTAPAVADEVAPMIVGGSDAEFPIMVDLQVNVPNDETPDPNDTKPDHECGASLIIHDQRTGWLLTAGHCAEHAGPGTKARFNSLYWASGGVMGTVVQAIPHQQFELATLSNDIALVRVRFDKPQFEKLPTLPIVWPNQPGSLSRVSGWGTTCDIDISDPACRYDLPDKLQQLDLKRLAGVSDDPKQDCSLVDPATGVDYFNPADMLCFASADGQAKAACFGDSGGPVTQLLPKKRGSQQKQEQRGVVAIVSSDGDSLNLHPNLCSTGEDGSVPGKLHATNVSRYFWWIYTTMYTYDKAAASEVRYQAQAQLAA